MQSHADIPYQLLGQFNHDSPTQGTLNDEADAPQTAATAYITTMFYSALSNLYLQSILPADAAEVDAQMPRIKIALERSFADFTRAVTWLENHNELVNSSPAKDYYQEVMGLEKGAIKNMATFYAPTDQQQDETSPSQADLNGMLKFLHYYDPQNENHKMASDFLEFLSVNKDVVAMGGDDIVNDLYKKFKSQRNSNQE